EKGVFTVVDLGHHQETALPSSTPWDGAWSGTLPPDLRCARSILARVPAAKDAEGGGTRSRRWVQQSPAWPAWETTTAPRKDSSPPNRVRKRRYREDRGRKVYATTSIASYHNACRFNSMDFAHPPSSIVRGDSSTPCSRVRQPSYSGQTPFLSGDAETASGGAAAYRQTESAVAREDATAGTTRRRGSQRRRGTHRALLDFERRQPELLSGSRPPAAARRAKESRGRSLSEITTTVRSSFPIAIAP
ncbi:hypothetical protein EJB05_29952, partial [Eragrostis curvula]